MPTTVTKKIGATNTPVSMDYSTLAAFAAAVPADLVAADQIWDGQCYDQGTFTSNVAFGGNTTDATRYIVLECASGASFRDKVGVRTTALLYNASNGVTVQESGGSGYVVRSDVPYTHIKGLQIKASTYTTALQLSSNYLCSVDDCIIAGTGVGGNVVKDQAAFDGNTFNNCLIQFSGASGNAFRNAGAACHLNNCTIVNTGGTAGTSNGVATDYNNIVIKNCAVFGFDTFTTGTTAAGSDYNATDSASASTGSHNQTSLTFSAQFTNTTTDFRATSHTTGTGLHNGTPDSTNAPDDISGTSRDATNPYIGAWEPSAPAVSYTVTPSTIPEGHSGDITLTLTGTGTTFASGSTVAVHDSDSGTTTVTAGTWTRSSNTSATLKVTTGAGTGTWHLTVDGTDSPVLTVATPTLAVSPTSGVVSTTPTITFTGTNTVWSQETLAGLITAAGVSGVTLGSLTLGSPSDSIATATLTIGTNTGTVTFTDNSTGKTCTFAVNAVSGTIAVTSPVQYQTYQRNGSNQAGIPISGTYTGGPATKTVEASFNGGGYSTIATASAGSFSGTLTAQAAGQGTLTVRFVNAPGISTTVSTVGIGDVFVIAGQSNAFGELSAQQTFSGSLIATCFNGSTVTGTAYAAGAWQTANDPFYIGNAFGSPWPLLATLHMADQGVPCAFIETPFGGRSLANGTPAPWFFTKYRPDTGTGIGTGYGIITSQVTASGVNAVKCVLWYQGENDADGGVDEGSYGSAWITLANNLAVDLPGSPNMVPIQIGGSSANTFNRPVALGIADGARLAVNGLGLPTIYDVSNDLHISTNPEGQTVANRFWAVLKSEFFGGTSGNGHGPRVSSCQYNAARTMVTVCFDKVLKTGLTFSTSVWTVTGNGIAATVSSVDYHATDTRAVVLTLSGAASLPILVSLADIDSPAGLVVPLGPNFTLPGGAGTINLPAEMFKDQPAAASTVSAGGGGAILSRILTGM